MKKQSIISELFLLNESVGSFGDCAEYEKALEKVCIKEEAFIKEITSSSQEYELYQELKRCIDELHLTTLFLYYKKGFLDGFNLSEELNK